MHYSKKLSATFEEATIGILVVNRQEQILTVNPHFTKLFQYTVDEFKTLKVKELLPASFRKVRKQYRYGCLDNPRPRTMGTHPKMGCHICR